MRFGSLSLSKVSHGGVNHMLRSHVISEGHGSEGELRGWGRNKGRSDRGKGKERCNRRCHEDRGMECRDAELERRVKAGEG